MNSSINNIVFFDGFCVLCNKTVDFIMRKDKTNRFYFAPLQGQTAKKVIPDLLRMNTDTVIYYRSGRTFTESRAILEISRLLAKPYSFLYLTIIIPSFIRNFFYRLIAKKRYLIFGKLDYCRIGNISEKNILP